MDQYENPLPDLTRLGDQVRETKDIWEAVGILTNALGHRTGMHLESLILKESSKAIQEYTDLERKLYKRE